MRRHKYHSSTRVSTTALWVRSLGVQDRILRLRGERERIVAGGVGIEAFFPELIQPSAVANTA